jgi:UDP-N-acetylglucosamine--N-acetylmuramyl-(pentapeptide) pyrophosphoryl-undecaprenol N-acetylglucosamine transferase
MAPDDTPTFAVIAGGGTAGHVLPGLAVAEALVAAGHHRSSLRYAGAARGMEADLVPPSGLQSILLDLQGFQRQATLTNLRRNAVATVQLAGALARAFRLLGRLRPRVVVSVGGYASVPWVVGARLRRTPVVVVSYDAVPGLASRLAARFATHCAVAFATSTLPRKVVTGAPVREAVLAIEPERDRAGARTQLGLPAARFTVLVVGGSLGAGFLNGLTRAFVARHRDRGDLAVRHVVGNRNWDDGWAALDGGDGIVYQPVRYEDRMDLAYAATDLVVARAGATTVAELAAVGLPAVLVPWPLAADDHQTANARVLADAGGAVLVPEAEMTPERLAAEVDRLQRDSDRRSAMAANARSVARRDAASAIVALVEQAAGVRADEQR